MSAPLGGSDPLVPDTPLTAALAYATRGWPIFPCSSRRVPMVEDWPNAATTDPAIITAWWTEWRHALIGLPTGERTGIAVFDIDRKNGRDGLRTLADLGYLMEPWPCTPTVLTQSGGYHLHFERPNGGFRNTVGAGGRGVGEGLDWRCDGGYVVIPSPGSGYAWGEHNYDNCAPLPVPELLLPRTTLRSEPSRGVAGKGRLARLLGPTSSSLTGVLRCLGAAKRGERNQLLFWASCRVAEGVASGLIGDEDARTMIHGAARNTGLDDREIARTIDSAFGRVGV